VSALKPRLLRVHAGIPNVAAYAFEPLEQSWFAHLYWPGRSIVLSLAQASGPIRRANPMT
jgi:hypothetical protein